MCGQPGTTPVSGTEADVVVAVVLAGGEGRRFGGDKLAADLHGRSVLDRALEGLPDDAAVAIVGPERTPTRRATFLREEPPGGGPAAGMVAGLCWALDHRAGVILVLPGDAPSAGRAALLLASALDRTGAEAAVGVDRSGRDQVLQLALRPAAARALVDLAGPGAGRDQSVRRLVTALDPAPMRVELADHLTRDVDTAADLEHLRNSNRA
jgi:molybdenum cofactor guanylyltransferase